MINSDFKSNEFAHCILNFILLSLTTINEKNMLHLWLNLWGQSKRKSWHVQIYNENESKLKVESIVKKIGLAQNDPTN